MKRYARRKKFKVKKLFILLFAVMLCVMAGKVLHWYSIFYTSKTDNLCKKQSLRVLCEIQRRELLLLLRRDTGVLYKKQIYIG